MIWWAIPIGWFLADITGILYGIKKEKWFQTQQIEKNKIMEGENI